MPNMLSEVFIAFCQAAVLEAAVLEDGAKAANILAMGGVHLYCRQPVCAQAAPSPPGT
ncbi:MAG: hypothetical protein OXC07_08325 [Kistimonas sp.]|nr:hypothetical protein [Kistimonas sp.]